MVKVFSPLGGAIERASRVKMALEYVKELAPEVDRIELRNARAAEFITSVAGRLAADPGVFVTEKQLSWLQQLHDQWCG